MKHLSIILLLSLAAFGQSTSPIKVKSEAAALREERDHLLDQLITLEKEHDTLKSNWSMILKNYDELLKTQFSPVTIGQETFETEADFVSKFNSNEEMRVNQYRDLVEKYNNLRNAVIAVASSGNGDSQQNQKFSWSNVLRSTLIGAAKGSSQGSFGAGYNCAETGYCPTQQVVTPQPTIYCNTNTVGNYSQTSCQ